MSSTNDTYHHLLVQAQPKSILKKSSSPKFLDSSMNSEANLHTLSSTYEAEKDDIDENQTPVCILNDNQSVKTDNAYLPSIEVPLTELLMTSNEIASPSVRTLPCADSSSLTSDDDQQQQQRIRSKPKKNYHRPFVTTSILSSSSDNDERQAKRPIKESKTTSLHSNKHRQTDMQLDEFIRKYQQEGGILLPTKEDHEKGQITTKLSINHRQSGSLLHQPTSQFGKESTYDDTLGILESIAAITRSSTSLLPLQLLFDVAHEKRCDRRTKIDEIRQYVEEQIGISPFLTMYKLIKSSQIPIDIQQKPFCYYANFLPHLCCLIILESEEQKKSILR